MSRIVRKFSFNWPILICSLFVSIFTNLVYSISSSSSLFIYYKNTFSNLNNFSSSLSTGFISNLLVLLPISDNFKFFRLFLIFVLLYFSLSTIFLILNQQLNKPVTFVLIFLLILTPNNLRLFEFANNRIHLQISGSFFAQFPLPLLILFGLALIIRLSNFSNILKQLPSTLQRLLTSVVLFGIHPYLLVLLIVFYCSRIMFFVTLKKNSNFFRITKIRWYLIGIIESIALISVLYTIDSNLAIGSLNLSTNFEFRIFDLLFYNCLPLIIFVFSLKFANVSAYELWVRFDFFIALYFFDIFINVISIVTNRDFTLSYYALGLAYIIHLFILIPVFFLISRLNNLQKLKFIHQQSNLKIIQALPKVASMFSILVLVLSFSLYGIGLKNYVSSHHNHCSQLDKILQGYSLFRREAFDSEKRISGVQNMSGLFDSAKNFSEFMTPPNRTFFSFQSHSCTFKSIGFLLLNGPSFTSNDIVRATNVVNAARRTFDADE